MDAQMYACVVDYLTSFSGIVIFLSILWRCVFFLFLFFPLPSWQIDVQIVLFLVEMFAQFWTATFKSQFLFLYSRLYLIVNLRLVMYFLHLYEPAT